MGYDIYIRGENVPKAPRPDWDVKEPWGGEEHDAWTRKYYLCRNMSGGYVLAQALIELGMGFDAYAWGRPPEWPEGEGIDWARDFVDEDPRRPITEAGKRYQAAQNAVLDWHGPEIPGIPTHKVAGSNDGWHVTREEARAALKLYEIAIAAGKAHPEIFYDDFIPFLRTAAEHDGFETH